MVMVGTAFADLRDLATSASVAREWQRSSLAIFIPAVLRDGTARVTDICLEIDQCLRRLLHQRDEGAGYNGARSEEHTSELQSLMRISYAVFCLKKKKKRQKLYTHR